MHYFLTLIFLITGLLASLAGSPHDYIIEEEEKNKNCVDCHKVREQSLSLSCLGCHDGVIGPDRVINSPGSGGYYPTSNYLENSESNLANSSVNAPSLNEDLHNGHPISIIYIETVANLKEKNTVVYNWNNASSINDLLIEGKIECASCHNPHDKMRVLYLRHKNVGSKLCMTCHDK